jgi:predicted SprT family Zn-dependent metalloprotease
MFSYKGFNSDLGFIEQSKHNFKAIIDFFLNEYNLSNIDFLFSQYNPRKKEWTIILNDGDRPECDPFKKEIKLSPTDKDLRYYMQLDFQFSHELTHAIQYHQKRGLEIQIEVVNGTYAQKKIPNRSFQETEAVANSAWIIERVFKYN